MTIERKAGRDRYKTKTFRRITAQTMLSTAFGGIICTLADKVQTLIKVDRWFPSTQTCSRCGNIRDIGLDERRYACPVCGLMIDRDLNSSVNIEHEGLKQVIPMGCRDVKSVETESSTVTSLEYLNGISYITASSVVEAGSLTALA